MNPSVITPHNSAIIPNLVMIHEPLLKKMPAELGNLAQKRIYFQADLSPPWRFILFLKKHTMMALVFLLLKNLIDFIKATCE